MYKKKNSVKTETKSEPSLEPSTARQPAPQTTSPAGGPPAEDAPPSGFHPPESTPNGIVAMEVIELRPHPLNERVYAEEPIEEFIANVREHGILQALLITKDKRVISGHRRLAAATKCGLKAVPVVISPLEDEADIEKALIDANLSNRERTNEVKIREGRELHRIEKERAAKRKKAGKLVENLPEGVQKGASRDCAAKAVGLSGKTLEHGALVLKRIDEMKTEGRTEDAEKLRQLLNRSIDGAYKKVHSPKPKTTARPPAQPPEQPKDVEPPETPARAIESPSVFKGTHDSVLLKLDKELCDFSSDDSPLQALITPDAFIVVDIGEESLVNCIGTFQGLWNCEIRAVITILEQKEEYEEPTPCPLMLVVTPVNSQRDLDSDNIAIRLAHGEFPSDAAIAWMNEQGCASVHTTSLSELVDSTAPGVQK